MSGCCSKLPLKKCHLGATLNQMAAYKMNKLHLQHLTDDEVGV
ncbi:family 20 glycosylhydrolase [Vibrio chagasii]|nr:family 20 glycosylhydrolase [Vibrio chagasii]